jgi:hypothetical protein
MMKTKLIIVITAFVALGVLATGIVLAHNPYTSAIYPNERNAPDTSYYYGGCYGYDQYYRYQPSLEPNTSEQPITPSTPEQSTQPGYFYPPQRPNQDYSYGRGCWGW